MDVNYISILQRFAPNAVAELRGSQEYPALRARVSFYQTDSGVLVATEAAKLPGENSFGVFAFHIHEGTECTGNLEDPFADAKTHFNPAGAQHPYHAGDLPPLFSNYGHAFSVVLTDRFRVSDVLGRTVIIHSQPDDFTTQPAGNSGKKIACGTIEAFRRNSFYK